MFVIIRNAIRADNFAQFELFMKEFKTSNIIAKLKLSFSNVIAQYYLQYKHYNKAIAVYEIMATANPDNAKVQHTIGDIYLSMNNNITAKVYYQKAVNLAKKSKDERLAEYLTDLNKL